MSREDWADLSRHIHNQGIGELQTKGLTEEEENREMKKTFEDITKLGYGHIHTLKIVPLDSDRQPYFVHVDSINRE